MLIVDDEIATLEAMADYFGARDYDVDSATEREEAEALLDHRDYAVVICDLRLSGSLSAEGLDIVYRIRHGGGESKVILLTGDTSAEVEKIATELGVDWLLLKPQPLELIERVVAGVLENR